MSRTLLNESGNASMRTTWDVVYDNALIENSVVRNPALVASLILSLSDAAWRKPPFCISVSQPTSFHPYTHHLKFQNQPSRPPRCIRDLASILSSSTASTFQAEHDVVNARHLGGHGSHGGISRTMPPTMNSLTTPDRLQSCNCVVKISISCLP